MIFKARKDADNPDQSHVHVIVSCGESEDALFTAGILTMSQEAADKFIELVEYGKVPPL